MWDCSWALRDVLAGIHDKVAAAAPLGQPLWVEKLHQSGVNAVDVAVLPPRAPGARLRIVTGGDDNALTASTITVNDAGNNTTVEDDKPEQRLLCVSLLSTASVVSAHAASVTGEVDVCGGSFAVRPLV
eukprot:m.160628 g.160628  ORF g.160628 m.160628 type:complete len:129 (-) comp17628_c2_seq11:82-468(-)